MKGFERTLALRHLRSGGAQTLLTVSAVASGVLVMVFISSLVFGIRTHAAELLTDALPHVTITPPEPMPRGLGESDVSPGSLPLSQVERQNQQDKQIQNWQAIDRTIRSVPGVAAVAPVVASQGFISRGARRIGVQIYGADPQRMDAVTPMTKYLVSGRYLGLAAGEVFISYKASEDLGVGVGDHVRLTSTTGASETFLVRGIYDPGQQLNAAVAYVTLRSGQSLFGLGTAVHEILVRCTDLFAANDVADRIAPLVPYKVKSWAREWPHVMASLSAYNAVAVLVSVFSLVASGFAIASVLIVSVLQKSKQIGILKSMGARRVQILRVFLLEGLGVALVGAGIGAALGCGVIWVLSFFKQPVTRIGATPDVMFPSHLTWQLLVAAILSATVSTLLAAALPARRAASLDPVEVMR